MDFDDNFGAGTLPRGGAAGCAREASVPRLVHTTALFFRKPRPCRAEARPRMQIDTGYRQYFWYVSQKDVDPVLRHAKYVPTTGCRKLEDTAPPLSSRVGT